MDAIIYQVGGTSAGNVRAGIYREGAIQDRPDGGRLVAESSSVAQDAAARVQVIMLPSPVVLEPGPYHLAIQFDDVNATFYRVYDTRNLDSRIYDHTYGPFPDPCPTTSLSLTIPVMMLRVTKNLP